MQFLYSTRIFKSFMLLHIFAESYDNIYTNMQVLELLLGFVLLNFYLTMILIKEIAKDAQSVILFYISYIGILPFSFS